MAQGITHIKEEQRARGVLRELILCAEHATAEGWHPSESHDWDRDGYRLVVKPWTGAAVECSLCGLAPECRGTK